MFVINTGQKCQVEKERQEMGEAADVARRDIAASNGQDGKEVIAVCSPECEKEVPGARLRGHGMSGQAICEGGLTINLSGIAARVTELSRSP